MIYVIPGFLLLVVEADNDHFIRPLLRRWRAGRKLYRYDLPHGNTFLQRFTCTIRNLLQIKRLISSENYKILFFEWGGSLLQRVTSLFSIKKPVIVRVHRYEVFERTLSKVNFSKVTNIVFVSNHTRALFLKRFPKLIKKTVVIPNAVNLKQFVFPADKLTHCKICTLSGLEQRKRIDLVIKAMQSLPLPLELHIGGTGSLMPHLQQLITQAKLDNRVFLDGWIADLPAWYRDKDILVNASDDESFGVSIIEAMACEVIPFIRGWKAAADLYSSEYLLPFAGTPFVNALVARVSQFYKLTEHDRSVQRRAARKFVQDRYSIEVQNFRFNTLFNEVVK